MEFQLVPGDGVGYDGGREGTNWYIWRKSRRKWMWVSPFKKKKKKVSHLTALMIGSLWVINDDASLCALPAVTSDDANNNTSLYVFSSVTSESVASLYSFPAVTSDGASNDATFYVLPAVTSDGASNDTFLYVLPAVTSNSASSDASLYVFPTVTSEGACKYGCVCSVVTSEGVSNMVFCVTVPQWCQKTSVMMFVCLSVPQ